MSWSTISADQVRPQRWKNDGGWTRELLAWPHLADWAVRVSVADIERDGPFSAYPGVQRWFAVVSGAGVRLYDFELHVGSELLGFDGGLAPDCELVNGPTRDFNLMHRRDKGRLQVRPADEAPTLTAGAGAGAGVAAEGGAQRGAEGGAREGAGAAGWLGFFTAQGGVLTHGGRRMELAAQTLAWCEQPVAQPLAFEGRGPAWWMCWSAT